MGFVWNYFGILSKVEKTSDYIIISNHKGETRRMSRSKYQETADWVYKDALELVHDKVEIRTSQNTNDWDVSECFSDIGLANDNII